MDIVLASQSPRRCEILNSLGIKFDIYPSNIPEKINENDIKNSIQKLAFNKANFVASRIDYKALIIAADTVVISDKIILCKPKNEEDAYEMLKLLSGKWHEVCTGVCIYDNLTNKYIVDYEVTRVKFKTLSHLEIENYIKTKEPMDKAGSYAIQGIGSILIEKINGCYFNVVGLPIFKLSQMLSYFGVDIFKLRG